MLHILLIHWLRHSHFITWLRLFNLTWYTYVMGGAYIDLSIHDDTADNCHRFHSGVLPIAVYLWYSIICYILWTRFIAVWSYFILYLEVTDLYWYCLTALVGPHRRLLGGTCLSTIHILSLEVLGSDHCGRFLRWCYVFILCRCLISWSGDLTVR